MHSGYIQNKFPGNQKEFWYKTRSLSYKITNSILINGILPKQINILHNTKNDLQIKYRIDFI